MPVPDNNRLVLWDVIRIAAIGLVSFVPMLGRVHLFDWDEINFAESAREMLVSGDRLTVQIAFKPFWEKPPLFIWLQALSMSIFGVNEFAARLPNALTGVITLVLCYVAGRRIADRSFGWHWSLAMWGSILPHFYFKSGIIDPVFNLLTIAALWLFAEHYKTLTTLHSPTPRQRFLSLVRKIRAPRPESARTSGQFEPLGAARAAKTERTASLESEDKAPKTSTAPVLLAASSLFCGLAIMTKGPVALLVLLLAMAVYWVLGRCREPVPAQSIAVWVVGSLLLPGLWFGAITLKHGPRLIYDFFAYQYRLFITPDAGHAGFPGYHVVVLLIGCFPAVIFAIRRLFMQTDDPTTYDRWMRAVFWVVLVLFSVVQSKIVHYSSLCYLPLTFLAARTTHTLSSRSQPVSSTLRRLWLIQSVLTGCVAIALPIVALHPHLLKPLLAQDPFALAALEVDAGWAYWRTIAGWWLIGGGIWLYKYASGRPLTKRLQGMYYLTVAVFVQLSLIALIRPIEKHSQHSLIEKLKQLHAQAPDTWVAPDGFKSYAHLFYNRCQPERACLTADSSFYRHHGPRVLFTKINKAGRFIEAHQAEVMHSQGGYVFLRLPETPAH